MLQIGSIVDGKYKILNKIGHGGMSIVYLAMNERANKQWAIKEIRKDAAQNHEVVRRSLIAEINLLKRLRHPNLPGMIDVIEKDGTFLIVMDYIEGNPLNKVLREHGAQNQEEVVQWSIQLCDVLGYLHSQNPPIVYRDLKPSNVMLKPDGNVMLIDFGSARTFKMDSAADTTCLGTQGYAAPEQYGGQGQTDERTDIYCLGVTIYHLVTGHNPCEPPYEMYPIREWNPKLSSGLEQIIIKCTQRNPADRYQSCQELMYELEHYKELSVESRKVQKRKWKVFLASCSITMIAAISAKVFYMAETTVRKNSYDQYLQDAKSISDPGEQFILYEKAVNLCPKEGEAYLDLIDKCFLGDGRFTPDEDKKLRKILGVPSGKNYTNESCLKSNLWAYERFANRAAMAYFYYFSDADNKNGAIKWLEIVKNASTLDRNITERGKRLERIAEYYGNVGIQNLEGDTSITYLDYWKDLKELTQGNLVKKDNAKTALVMYEELIGQICNNCERFKNAGVSKQDILAQISNAQKHIKTDITIDCDGNIDLLEKDRKKLLKNISLARKIADSVYQPIFSKEGEENAGS